MESHVVISTGTAFASAGQAISKQRYIQLVTAITTITARPQPQPLPIHSLNPAIDSINRSHSHSHSHSYSHSYSRSNIRIATLRAQRLTLPHACTISDWGEAPECIQAATQHVFTYLGHILVHNTVRGLVDHHAQEAPDNKDHGDVQPHDTIAVEESKGVAGCAVAKGDYLQRRGRLIVERIGAVAGLQLQAKSGYTCMQAGTAPCDAGQCRS